MIETKAPEAYCFKWFMDELAKEEPWCSAAEDDEVGWWVIGSFDVLERTLMNISNRPSTHERLAARCRVYSILFGPGTVRERHEELHKFLMTL